MDLVTTPAHNEANSYITLNEATNYFNVYNRIPTDSTWNNLSDDQKRYALILSAYAMNTLQYRGIKITKTQPLEFPRYKLPDITKYSKTIYYNFDDAVIDSNLIPVVTNSPINIVNGILIPNDSGILFSGINKLDVINIEGYLTESNNGYFTIKSYTDTSISVYEELTDEIGSNIYIYKTPLIGVNENIRFAQAELAWQVINTNIFQKEITDTPEQMIRAFRLGGALSLNYWKSMAVNKFGSNTTTPLDLVFFLLSDWITSVRGAIV